MRKNSRSDLAINERFFARSEQGELIATDVPDRVRIDYFTPERKRVWTCSRNGDEYHDCSLSPDGKSLVCRLALSRVYLGEGPLLKVVRTTDDDPAFPDSVRKSGFLASTGIDLWAGPPESGEVESSVVPDTVLYGYSAYRLAVLNGFEGTEQEWLESLIGLQGKSAYQVAVDNGFVGTVSEWLASLVGAPGKSAYQVAVDNGFEGTQAEWLESLIGDEGKSAYQVAVDNGFEGTVAEWLASLVGAPGKSAYQVAVDNGFEGTQTEWLASLVGPQGLSAYQVAVVNGYEGTVGEWLASLVGPAGPPGVTSCVVTVDNTSGDSPGGEASVENSVLTLRLFGIRGLPGVGIDDVATPVVVDGTFNILLTNGNVVTVDLNHQHAAYYSKVADTAQPSGGFLPDVIYKLGTLTGSVTFALAAAVSGNANHYFIVFETGGTAPTITWPSGLTWAAGSAPTLAANKHYEVSIMDGVAAYLEV